MRIKLLLPIFLLTAGWLSFQVLESGPAAGTGKSDGKPVSITGKIFHIGNGDKPDWEKFSTIKPSHRFALRLFFDAALSEKVLAQPMTPELLDVSLKNRHTVARLGWEPRMHDPFLHKWLHRLDVPVKIVWGEADRILPVAYAQEFKKLMPAAEVEVVPHCGHLPQTEKPEEFCDIVFRFTGKR